MKKKIVGNTMITILETIHGNEDPISIFYLFIYFGMKMVKKLITNSFGTYIDIGLNFFFFWLRNDIGLKLSVYKNKISIMVD